MENRERKETKNPLNTNKDYTIFDALIETLNKQKGKPEQRNFLRHQITLTNLTVLFLIVAGSIILLWVGQLTWHDITVCSKNISLIFLGSRTGENISLGIGMTLIHYYLIGFALLLSAVVKLIRKKGEH
jgi:hypothetical protein